MHQNAVGRVQNGAMCTLAPSASLNFSPKDTKRERFADIVHIATLCTGKWGTWGVIRGVTVCKLEADPKLVIYGSVNTKLTNALTTYQCHCHQNHQTEVKPP